MEQWASLMRQAHPSPGLSYKDAKAQALCHEGICGQFTKVDKNGDDSMSREELERKFGSSQAQNLLGFHDLDEDGSITRAEFAEVFGLWAGTVKAVIEETPKKWRKYQLEDMVGDFNIEDLPESLTKKMEKASRKSELAYSLATSGTRSGEL